MSHADTLHDLLARLGVELPAAAAPLLDVHTPIDGSRLAQLAADTPASAARRIDLAVRRQQDWQMLPAPQRGAVVRAFGERVRRHKPALGELIALEVGKIRQEGLGEVQEVIDICEFALGLSRQLYGLTIASERPEHQLRETWHPLGAVGVITAFNFPMAVWAWNAALALVCGNTVVWKPSEKAPLSALALQQLLCEALAECGQAPEGVAGVLLGGREIGEALVQHPLLRLVSATGSSAMGSAVAQACAPRFRRVLLELGGNNAAIVCPSADLELALRAITFAAAGTAGQRCTTLRRLFVHESLYATLVQRLQAIYAHLPVGDPLHEGTLVGPLIDGRAFEAMQAALERARQLGARVHGGERLPLGGAHAWYVRPALVEMPRQAGPMLEETFAPILYLMPYADFDTAIASCNASAHGLSAAVFTNDLREAERFCSHQGSDCGIVNVNIGTSGAEIGGAFGGEKATGGGREAGSDAWKAYMRRATNTVNYGRALPLAQGIRFEP